MLAFDISTSAPGKILLLGGYSVLERPNIGYVITVNSRVHARIKSLGDNQIKIKSPQFKLEVSGTLKSTGELAVELPQEMDVLRSAIEIPIKYLVGLGEQPQGFYIETSNDPEFASGKGKTGLGSSAAVTVAVVAAVLATANLDNDIEVVHKLAQISHSMATKKVGSGFDIAAATYGSLIYSRYSPELIKAIPKEYPPSDIVKAVKSKWDYKTESFPFPDRFGLIFAGFRDAGTSTVSGVSKVNEFKAANPEGYESIIKQINSANREAMAALKEIEKSQDALQKFKEVFEIGRRLTKDLGNLADFEIEPDDCTDMIEKSKSNGAFVAKLPGAGGRDAIVALTEDQDNRRRLIKYLESVDMLELLDVKPGNAGVKVERS